jgi:multidrug efflux pump subunit AcrB
MLYFLLKRPIAVFMVLLVALSLSVLAFLKLPISLLPDKDVPEITVSVRFPNSPPEEIEQNILKPIRETMLAVNGLKHIETIAHNEAGSVMLHFEYETPMELAYIEVNEKLDKLTNALPRSLERPLVVKASTSDIPIARVQVLSTTDDDLVSTSELARFTLKRRLEQLEGIGLVDINGWKQNVIRVAPDATRLASLGLTDNALITAIQDANLQLGALTVRDGNYRYFLKVSSRLSDPDEIGQLPVQLPNGNESVKLNQIAKIFSEVEKPLGFHLFNGNDAIVITVHKQATAKMTEVMPRLYEAVEQFRQDYSQLNFEITQDQSLLLDISIDNLSQALLWGGLFAFAVLFLFMGNWREPFIMGIVLPVSLLLSFSLLYLLNISLNIISLSGLALGLGMLVDNSIVIVDNISLKRREGLLLTDACVQGTHEVIIPLISSALTNLAVFIPLIFMSGITGALFYDQALSVTAILTSSVLCTFILVPLLYKLLYQNNNTHLPEDSRFFITMKRWYHRSFLFVFRYKLTSLLLMGVFIPVSILLFIYLPKTGFPLIERTESVINIDWNEPIPVTESKARIMQLVESYKPYVAHTEAEVGQRQFMLGTDVFTAQQATLYLKYPNQHAKNNFDTTLVHQLKSRFPLARIDMQNAPNAFEQLFTSRQPHYEARFREPKSLKTLPDSTAQALFQKTAHHMPVTAGKGFETETVAVINLDFIKMKTYQVDYADLIRKLNLVFGDFLITDFKDFGKVTPVRFTTVPGDFTHLLQTNTVRSANGKDYPVTEFIQMRYEDHYKNLTADASGMYQSLLLTSVPDVKNTDDFFTGLARNFNLSVDFSGQWFENEANLKQLFFILLVSVLLMYFILTAEFESFRQPLLVMVSIPLGFAGSLLLLWALGGTLNVMSGIGLVVVLGILDNDAILKIDRINRLRQHLPLAQAIEQAGLDRLKPIVMNTCTNVLAITPILFASGLGADLQQPVAITTIGGLIAATFTALYFIPTLYWFSSSQKL